MAGAVRGFSLHAGTALEGEERGKLERLVRYGAVSRGRHRSHCSSRVVWGEGVSLLVRSKGNLAINPMVEA
jgi:hypothetical protein